MNFLQRLFGLSFDEPKVSTDPADEGAKVDAQGNIILDIKAVEKEVDKHFDLKADESPAKVEKEVEAEESEEVDQEKANNEEELDPDDPRNDPDFDVDEDDEEVEDEETEGEEIADPVISKRLSDTQKAFRQERQKRKELEKEVAEIKAKISPPPAAKEPAPAKKETETPELTLLTVPQDLLQKMLRENPVGTTRWIADQQYKMSHEGQKKADQEVADKAARESRIKTSEDLVAKKFPVLQEVLDMKDEQIAKLKTEKPVQYLFAKKTAKYYKEFEARGDEEALYNAATRAYVELSPNMIKEVQQATKALTKQELVTKKRVLGKVQVGKNTGKGSGGSGFKKLSEDEYMALTPEKQRAYDEQSVDRKIAARNGK